MVKKSFAFHAKEVAKLFKTFFAVFEKNISSSYLQKAFLSKVIWG